MDRLLKLSVAALLLATVAGAAWAAGGGGEPKAPFPVPLACYMSDPGSPEFQASHCDLIHGIEAYRDPVGVGIGELLSHRISANPFNLIGSLIFLIAILHTFMANKLTEMAHQIHEEHDERMKAAGATSDEITHDIPLKAELFHFLGEVEVVFGMWVVALMVIMIGYFGDWSTFKDYIAHDRNYIEPLFVVVIMAIASTRPVVKFAEKLLGLAAGIGGHSPAAWWLSILTIAPLLGSLITEPAAMTIAALLLANQFYRLKPSPWFAYGTLGLLFVNVSVGGTATHFAAPPVLMVASTWEWTLGFMAANFGWKAALGIVLANLLYFMAFRGELAKMASGEVAEEGTKLKPRQMSHEDFENMWAERDAPIPGWVTLVSLLFMGWTVFNAHYPPLFIGGFLFFLGFTVLTGTHQNHIELKSPVMVGFFLAGLVTLGGLQAWWIAPVLGSLPDLPLMLTATVLTAFNDNAAITYLATLVPAEAFGETARYAVVAGAVTGGGLTVIANAPNPAGQSILGRFFHGGVNPAKLAICAIIPTIIMGVCFMAIPFTGVVTEVVTGGG